MQPPPAEKRRSAVRLEDREVLDRGGELIGIDPHFFDVDPTAKLGAPPLLDLRFHDHGQDEESDDGIEREERRHDEKTLPESRSPLHEITVRACPRSSIPTPRRRYRPLNLENAVEPLIVTNDH